MLWHGLVPHLGFQAIGTSFLNGAEFNCLAWGFRGHCNWMASVSHGAWGYFLSDLHGLANNLV